MLKRLPIISLILFVIISISALWFWYLKSYSFPQNVTLTDLTNNSATIVWTTTKPQPSTIYYSESELSLKLLPISFPFVSVARNSQKSINHHIELKNLSRNKKYYFVVANNLHFYHYQRVKFSNLMQTSSKQSQTPLPVIKMNSNVNSDQAKTLIKGFIINKNNKPVSGALAIIKNNSQTYSGVTDSKGYFRIAIDTGDSPLFVTAINGTKTEKNILLAPALFGQPMLITLDGI